MAGNEGKRIAVSWGFVGPTNSQGSCKAYEEITLPGSPLVILWENAFKNPAAKLLLQNGYSFMPV